MKKIKSLKVAIMAILVSTIVTACSLTTPITATSNPVGQKVGEASASVFFGIYFDVDLSIRTAALNGNITKISTVDFKREGLYPFFVTYTTIVTGE